MLVWTTVSWSKKQITSGKFSMENVNIVVVTPVRNEEKFIDKTIASVINQTIKPKRWIIVNDGSTDKTQEIVEQRVQENDWITLVNSRDRGFSSVGRGIVESFHKGYQEVKDLPWDFLVKMDGDIALEPDYFENLLRHFRQDETLGVGGATCYLKEEDGTLSEERTPTFHPIAAARMYRRKCYEEIGGLALTNAWDTVDLLRARSRGWTTRRFPELRIVHYRIMSSRTGLWEGKKRTGRNLYLTGYSTIFLIARCTYRLFKKPYFVESAGVMFGYFRAMLKREPRVVTDKEMAFIRKEQFQRLLGKNK